MTPLLALAADRLLGEPPLSLHPVVWMGKSLEVLGRHIPEAPRKAFRQGMLAWCAGIAPWILAGLVLEYALSPLGWWALPVKALLAFPFLSLSLLRTEVRGVETALGDGLEAGRGRLSRIVSRDTRSLSANEVRESALESLSENLTDSVTAPLFWLLVLGLPGLFAYRFANTADATWGYRDHREWFGKMAARADDALNWLPSRLTGLLLCPPRLWGDLVRQSRLTPSPNGGWTMGALALRLGVRLGKPGVYVLNEAAPSPTSEQTAQALQAVSACAWTMAGLLSLIELLRWTLP